MRKQGAITNKLEVFPITAAKQPSRYIHKLN